MSMHDTTFEIDGFRLGHWTHSSGETGCTVLLADTLSPAAVDVRGGAPGSRETALLDSSCTHRVLDAVLLTGGSAFGLAAADGVMDWLKDRQRGIPTHSIPVPLVAGAVIFDLVGSDPQTPDREAGYLAASNATSRWESGRHGAGAGATVSKALGREHAIRAGIGVARIECPAGTVGAVFVVNAVGDIVDDQSGTPITTPAGGGSTSEQILLAQGDSTRFGENTVIGAVVCDRPLDSSALVRMTVAAHSGLARVVRPSHTPHDGDTIFALANGSGSVTSRDLLQLSTAVQVAVSKAITSSVLSVAR